MWPSSRSSLWNPALGPKMLAFLRQEVLPASLPSRAALLPLPKVPLAQWIPCFLHLMVG